MPVAADVLNSITGFLTGINQQAEANQARQVEALRLLASQPGASIVPATQAQPASFLHRLFGQPYAPNAEGAPVVNLGGQALTVGQVPTIAEALPDLFESPPEGLEGILPILGRIKATPQALQGVASTLVNAQNAREARKVREAQLTQQQERQRALDEDRQFQRFNAIQNRGAAADARQQALESRERIQGRGLDLKTEDQRTKALQDLHTRYSDAGQPVPAEYQDPALPIEAIRAGLLKAPAAVPKKTGGTRGLTSNAQAALVTKIIKASQESGKPLTPDEEAALAKGDALTITDLAPIYARVLGGKGTDATRYIKEIATAHEKIRKLTEGGQGLFGAIPGMKDLQDPEQKKAREAAIAAQKARIRTNAQQLAKLPGQAEIARSILEELGDAVGAPDAATPTAPAVPAATTPAATAPPVGSSLPVPQSPPGAPVIKSITRRQ